MSSKDSPTEGFPAHPPSSQPSGGKLDREKNSYVDPGSPDEKVDGVRNAEAAYKVYGRFSKWFLFVG